MFVIYLCPTDLEPIFSFNLNKLFSFLYLHLSCICEVKISLFNLHFAKLNRPSSFNLLSQHKIPIPLSILISLPLNFLSKLIFLKQVIPMCLAFHFTLSNFIPFLSFNCTSVIIWWFFIQAVFHQLCHPHKVLSTVYHLQPNTFNVKTLLVFFFHFSSCRTTPRNDLYTDGVLTKPVHLLNIHVKGPGAFPFLVISK